MIRLPALRSIHFGFGLVAAAAINSIACSSSGTQGPGGSPNTGAVNPPTGGTGGNVSGATDAADSGTGVVSTGTACDAICANYDKLCPSTDSKCDVSQCEALGDDVKSCIQAATSCASANKCVAYCANGDMLSYACVNYGDMATCNKVKGCGWSGDKLCIGQPATCDTLKSADECNVNKMCQWVE